MPGASGDPDRSPAARRGEALVEICRRALAGQIPIPGRRQRPHINLTVDVIGLGLAGSTHIAPGRLDDGTALDQAATRRLLCDANIHRHITAGRSVILDHGTATRTINPGLFQALALRDGGCRWPGCDRPHAWCEAHHVTRWLAGGATNPRNLVLLCARHHHLTHGQHDHRPGWHVALRHRRHPHHHQPRRHHCPEPPAAVTPGRPAATPATPPHTGRGRVAA